VFNVESREFARGVLSPITRCVKLLQDLAKQIESEAKQEQELYESFVCWGQSVVATKTASNSAAESRTDMLKQYIADIDAGRVEFTTERQDLEKEIEELQADLETATSQRSQENKDFIEAKDEMVKAINALESAVEVLETATKDHKTGVLFSMRSGVNEGFAARVAQGASLHHAVELSEKFLSRGDSTFLRRLLTGEVPSPEWKKLNRKATFKMSYKARSFKIQEVLGKLMNNFKKNLQESESKEAEEKATFEKLKSSKSEQLKKVQEALTNMEKENGAKGMSKADAEEEVEALELQVTNDKKFISETEAALVTKKTEYTERKKLQAGELQAISEAVAILTSGDAKDNFKKSFASQGLFFIQTNQQSTKANVLARVSQEIKEMARRTNDGRLIALLQSAANSGEFDEVVKAIDKMIALLNSEQAQDLENKQDCEKTRMEDTRSAIKGSREIDDLSDTQMKLASDIKDLTQEKEETEAALKQATDEMNEATKLREEEKASWTQSDAIDKDASDTVAMAKETLAKFYSDNGLVLAQRQPQAAAGEAPLPPPATWEGSYKGKVGESQGIIGMLEMIKEDIDKDRATAKSAEDKAQASYDKALSEFQAQEKDYLQSISDLGGQIGDKVKDEETAKADRATKKGELDATLDKIKNADGGCNYIEVNYPLRVKNRQVEIDGLIKAKAILSGASFTAPADPSREIKPGDAFLQRAHRH
jgi:hypothetical protein